MEKKQKGFRNILKWLIFAFIISAVEIPLIIFLMRPDIKRENNSASGKKIGKETIYLNQEAHSAKARYICPEDMAVIPSHETDWVWIVKQNGKHERIKGKIRKINAFCMDRYEYPNRKNRLPKTRVSYLEAVELCKLEGKRLCSEFEWDYACSGENNHPYVYGPQKELFRCNTDQVPEGAYEWIAPSGSHPGCRNKFGVYDLNGNVSEWVAMREHVNKGIVRGGTAWNSNEYGQSCFSRHMHLVNDNSWPDDGFRCCKSAIPRNFEEINQK